MLCNIPPIYVPVISFVNYVKGYKLDKYFVIHKPQKDSFYLNAYIQKFELSKNSLKFINESLESVNMYNNLQSRFKFTHNNINRLTKRNFHTKRDSMKLNDNMKTVDLEIAKIKSKDSIKELLNKFKSSPQIRRDIFKAYQLGYDRPLGAQNDAKSVLKYQIIYNIVAIVCGILVSLYLAYVLSNSMGKFGKNCETTFVTKVKVKFDDVQGCDEVKHDLQDIVSFLKNPSNFTEIGAKMPKGVLLSGKPGVGKTLLARAIAGEAGVPFLLVSGSQFDEVFVGVGASRVRDLFKKAKENSPCIIFIDELDAVCRKRTSSIWPNSNQTINQILSEMDGFVENEGIIVIGATNRVEDVDSAVLRPGRFDFQITIHPPDFRGRMALFNLYLSKILTNGNIDVQSLAKSTIGSTGADIKNIVNQAAIICALKGDSAVTMSHILESETKLAMGSARNRLTDEKEKILTAYHEAGHTIVTYFTPNSPDKVKAVTIIPRGQSGGHTSTIPKHEYDFRTKSQLMALIDGAMGGRAAEELLNGLDNISSGIYSDMKSATALAKQMVQMFSMSEEVGLRVYDDKQCYCGNVSSSPKMAETIDTEINRILKDSYLRAKTVIQEHQKEWHLLAKALLKYETLQGDDIELVINGKPPKIAAINDEIKQKPSLVNSISRILFEKD